MRLTVFTPTYNRRELLTRAYESLKSQTVKDFEWLIVDDGSTDDTMRVVDEWIKEGVITVRYHYRENGGKMRAHNTGAALSECELFVCLDSDDVFVPTAVEELLAAYDGAKENGTDSQKIGGVVAHKGCTSEKLLGSRDFPPVKTSTLFGLYLNGFEGETTLMYETVLLRQFPFPEIAGEKYVPEDYIYDKIDGNYLLRAVPKVLTVCELVENGYTDSLKRLKKENPVGWYLYYEQRARITPPSVLKLKYAGYYTVYAYRTGNLRESSLPFVWRAAGLFAALLLKLTGKE
jgi:glycosyltransferase involved in cell wall biosynthesis